MAYSSLSKAQNLLCLIVCVGFLYYMIKRYSALPSSTAIANISVNLFPFTTLTLCNESDPRENYKRAKNLFNETFSLEDIDAIASEEISRHNCTAAILNEHKIIIIVPYRNRKQDLLAFLLHMIPYFRRQGKKMEILIAEQSGIGPFNRAKLFNAAIREIQKSALEGKGNRLAESTCFALHDVDKLPEPPDVPYSCVEGPLQLMRLWKHEGGVESVYSTFLGGVTMFSMEQLEKMNGASNAFEGWGGEDDDLWQRIQMVGMKVILAPMDKSQFYEGSFNHSRNINPNRLKLLARKNQRSIMLNEGLLQVDYSLITRIDFKTFVWLLLRV